jgi:hypothetical protein
MKKILLIIFAVLLTLTAAVYQRKTGPTYEKKFEFEYKNTEYKLTLPRSHAGENACNVDLILPTKDLEAKIYYKKFPTHDAFTEADFTRVGDTLSAELPLQPQAGKLAYYVEVYAGEKVVFSSKEKVVQIRFRGDVPAWAMLPHIIMVFFGMLFANIAGLFAAFNLRFKTPLIIAFFLFLGGGMIFGPIVQNFAFSEYWAGIPNGWDLTDNKMLIGFVAWGIALIANLKKNRRVWVVAAAIVIIVIFSIPHSMYGSEYNYETGEVIQG